MTWKDTLEIGFAALVSVVRGVSRATGLSAARDTGRTRLGTARTVQATLAARIATSSSWPGRSVRPRRFELAPHRAASGKRNEVGFRPLVLFTMEATWRSLICVRGR